MNAVAANPPERDLLLGMLLGGKFRVQTVLGRGGTGRVYRAVQEPIGRAVAVKVLRVDLPPEELRPFEVRFLREASQAGALQHPNVVTVHDFGRAEDGTLYLVMELLRGRPLKDLLRDGAVPVARSLAIFEQMIRGLRAAHAAGMVHRDVKPGNIFLLDGDDGADFVKILDFGLVKDLDAGMHVHDGAGLEGLTMSLDDLSSESTVTRHGVFVGTPHYVAPEQARGMPVDGRADLYSAGVVLYRMLTGKLPFYDRNAAVLALSHVQKPYPPMVERAPEVAVPAIVEALVRRCMAKSPDDRYADADALLVDLAALRAALAAESAPSPLISSDTLSREDGTVPVLVQPSRPRGRGLLAAVALLGLGALGAVGVAIGLRPEPVQAVEQAVPGPKVFLSSEPPGAAVLLDGVALGATPLVWEAPTGTDRTLRFTFQLAGYVPQPLELAVSGEQAIGRVALVAEAPAVAADPAPAKAPREARVARAPEATPRATSPADPPADNAPVAVAPAASGGVVADGIPFTAAQASAALRFLNEATEEQLFGAGIAGRQVKLIAQGRPWADVASFANTPYIGEKTVQAVRDHAR